MVVPLQAVIAIYARETGQGMGMPEEPQSDATEMTTQEPEAADSPPETKPEPPKRGNHLRIIK